MHKVTLSHLLPNSRLIVTKTVTVDDTPRPTGWVEINSHSVWICRWMREFYGVGVHAPGEWMLRKTPYPIKPHRRKMAKAFVQETP